MNKPVTREETYLAAMSGAEVNLPRPVTREEYYLAAGAGMDVDLPDPITRKELFLKRIAERGGNGEGSGGGEDAFLAYVNNTLEEVDSDAIQSVRYYTFLDKTAIRRVNLPECTKFGIQAFKNCTGLEEVRLEKFTGGNHGSVMEIFAGCSGLHTIHVPEIDTVPASFLRNCISLKNFLFGSKLGWMNDYCLANTAIEVFAAPSVVYMTNGVFCDCRQLEKVDITLSQTNCSLGNTAFKNCEKLKTLILRATNRVVTLGNVGAFEGTPFAAGGSGGTVYVPAARISEYQQATNWSTLYAAGTCVFAAIEGSEYE